jgi:molecular chaperone DnaK (HSP70)
MKFLATRTLSGLLLSSLAVFAACQSSGGHTEVEATSSRMDSLKTNAETLKTEAATAAASLNDLVAKAETDPKPAFDKYTKDAKAVEATYNAAASRLAEVRTEADKLFKSWEEKSKTITDPDLQKSSEERRAKLRKSLEEVGKVTQEALDETKGFVATNTDLVKYLGQDLTPAGIKAASDKAKKQSKAADEIGEKLDDVVKVAGKASAEFATAKPPPPPPK